MLADFPRDWSTRQLRAREYLERNCLDEADKDCAVLDQVVDPEFERSAACAEVARRRGDRKLAVKRATQVIERWPNDLAALLSRARALAAEGNLEGSNGDLARVLRADPFNHDALNGRAWNRVARCDFAGGREDADKALKSSPHWPAALGTRCFALVGLGELTAARRDCEESVRLSPRNPIDRGMIAFLDGHRAEAVRLWKSAVQSDPGDATALEPWIAKASGR